MNADKMRDAWLEPDEYDVCPTCEDNGRDGVVEGDKWEWWCSHPDCDYGGDSFEINLVK